jgi:hypothetical protein
MSNRRANTEHEERRARTEHDFGVLKRSTRNGVLIRSTKNGVLKTEHDSDFTCGLSAWTLYVNVGTDPTYGKPLFTYNVASQDRQGPMRLAGPHTQSQRS